MLLLTRPESAEGDAGWKGAPDAAGGADPIEVYGTWPITFAVQERALELLLELYAVEATAQVQAGLLANVMLALGCLSMNKLYTPRAALWRKATRGLAKILATGLPVLDTEKPSTTGDSAWCAIANVLQAFFLIPPQPVFSLPDDTTDDFSAETVSPEHDLALEVLLLDTLADHVLTTCATCPQPALEQLLYIMAGGVLRRPTESEVVAPERSLAF